MTNVYIIFTFARDRSLYMVFNSLKEKKHSKHNVVFYIFSSISTFITLIVEGPGVARGIKKN